MCQMMKRKVSFIVHNWRLPLSVGQLRRGRRGRKHFVTTRGNAIANAQVSRINLGPSFIYDKLSSSRGDENHTVAFGSSSSSSTPKMTEQLFIEQ